MSYSKWDKSASFSKKLEKHKLWVFGSQIQKLWKNWTAIEKVTSDVYILKMENIKMKGAPFPNYCTTVNK